MHCDSYERLRHAMSLRNWEFKLHIIRITRVECRPFRAPSWALANPGLTPLGCASFGPSGLVDWWFARHSQFSLSVLGTVDLCVAGHSAKEESGPLYCAGN